jgi:pteridine reductase
MNTTSPVALITGSAQRIGAAIVRKLHTAGYNVLIHYRHSQESADALADELNRIRAHSAICLQADLLQMNGVAQLAQQALAQWQRVDALINSASAFYPTPVGTCTESQWDDIMGSNLKAPFFLAQALAETLAKHRGCIINIADIYAEKPLPQHAIYCMAKAGNVMLTKSLARDMAPAVRVNGIAPGAILWPEAGGATDGAAREKILASIPLQRIGSAEDIADTIVFLLRDAPYITGQIIAVDGGRSLMQ